MNRIDQDLKNGTVGNLYLLYGEEGYLRRYYKKRLQEAVLPPGDAMNRSVFTGKDIDLMKVIDLAETLPFLAPRRLIVIERSGLFKGTVDDRFVEYMKQVPEETVFLFDEVEIDKRGRLYKAVAKAGCAEECKTPGEEDLKRWIAKGLKQAGKQIRSSTAGLIVERSGMDMGILEGEVEKLISYTGDRTEVTDRDVMEVGAVQASDLIFEMVDAIAEGRQKRALELYYDLIRVKEAPVKILFLIAREFNLLLQCKDLKRTGMSGAEMARIMKVPPFAVRKYDKAASKFSRSALLKAMSDCVEADRDIKTGRMGDRYSVELIILRYSSGNDVQRA